MNAVSSIQDTPRVVALAIARPDVLFGSPFLQAVGIVTLAAFLVLSRAYFFSIPLAGMATATALYVGALALART